MPKRPPSPGKHGSGGPVNFQARPFLSQFQAGNFCPLYISQLRKPSGHPLRHRGPQPLSRRLLIFDQPFMTLKI